MKLFSIILVLSSIARRAELQTRAQLRDSQDRLYFADMNYRSQAIDRVTTEKSDVDVQKSVEFKRQSEQNFLPTIPTSAYSTTVKQNANIRSDLHRVYLQLQPAVFLNDPNYYGNRFNDDIGTFRPIGSVPLQNQAPTQSKLPQAQSQLQPQKEQSQVFNHQVQPVRASNSQTSDMQQNSKNSELNSQIPGQNVQNPLQIQTTQTPEGNAPVSRAVANFGLNLLRSIHSTSNVVVSPFSIVALLALLQQGALGETQRQITTTLQMNPDYSAASFKTFLDDIQKRTSRNLLKVANNIFIADAFDLNKMFKSIALRQFGSEVTSMKFYRSDAVDKINQWVSTKTSNKIERLISQDAVSENTQVVLINAVYFKGLWAMKFRSKATLPREFQYSDGSIKSVPFMHTKQALKTGYDNELGSQVLILPFENEQYLLMILLPSTLSTLDVLVSKLTDERLIKYNNMFSPRDVDVRLPKFTARADIDLDPVFRKMGITNIFGYQSELSGVGTYRTHSPQVSTAVHSAMLSIDEEGGTAAAATVISAVALSYDHDSILSFNANRPFLAVLWDNQSTMPLFMAKVENPIA